MAQKYICSMDSNLRENSLKIQIQLLCTVCPRSSDPFTIVSYYMKWVTTSWTYSKQSPGDNSLYAPNQHFYILTP